MIITFPIASFAEAAKAVRKTSGASSDIEIYDHARLQATKTGLTLTMSDLDIEARATIDCESPGDCLAAIPRAVLEFFIARQGVGEAMGTLEFDSDMRGVIARHGKARLTMPILHGEDFYLLDVGKPDWSLTIRAHEFCDALRRCEKAVGDDINRPMLHGPFLHQAEGALRMVASDSHRLHLVMIDDPSLTGALPPRNGTLPGIIIPPRTVKEILRILAGDESEVTVSGTARMMAIEATRIRIASKLIDATYFEYTRVIPPLPAPHVSVSTEALLRAVDGVLVVPQRDMKGKVEAIRTVRMTIQGGTVELFATGNAGDARDEVEIVNDGVPEGTQIMFHAQFLRDALDAARAKQVTIHPPAAIGQFFHVAGSEGATFVIGQRRL